MRASLRFGLQSTRNDPKLNAFCGGHSTSPIERTDSHGKPCDFVEAKSHRDRLTPSVALGEDLAQFAGEGFGFAGDIQIRRL
jgi:hypothetical protein